MTSTAMASCDRCGRNLHPDFRFCPECGLSTIERGVLSTQIQEVRQQAEEHRSGALGRDLRRVVVPAFWFTVLVTVGGLGVLLFSPRLLDRFLSTATVAEPPPPRYRPSDWEPEWVSITRGDFVSGPPDDARMATVERDFLMSRYEVTNKQWWEFLKAEAETLEQDGRWQEAVPGGEGGWVIDELGVPAPASASALQQPVRNVSAIAAIYFSRWLTRRLGEPGVVIRLPTRVEWEYAARGSDKRQFPWGNDFWSLPAVGTGQVPRTARMALSQNEPLPVSVLTDDISAFEVMGMGTNVAEWVLFFHPGPDDDLPRGVEIRGAAFNHQPGTRDEPNELTVRRASAWNGRDSESRFQFAHVGVRLVKEHVSR